MARFVELVAFIININKISTCVMWLVAPTFALKMIFEVFRGIKSEAIVMKKEIYFLRVIILLLIVIILLLIIKKDANLIMV